MNMHFQTFRLQPPHAPPSAGHASCSGRTWPPIRFASLSAVLRTSLSTRSLVSRIRPYRVCIATRVWAAVLRTIRSLPVALHPVSPRRSYFQLPAGSSAREGLSPPCARSLSSARMRALLRRSGHPAIPCETPRSWPATFPYVEGYDVERYVIKEPFHLLVFWVCSNRLWRSEK